MSPRIGLLLAGLAFSFLALAGGLIPPATTAADPPSPGRIAPPGPLGGSTASPTPCSWGGWSERRPYAWDVQGNAAVSLGGLLYSFGGDGTTNAYAYDPTDDTWTLLAPMPQGRSSLAA